MKTLGMMGALVAILGAMLVQASGAELTKDEKDAMLQLRELSKKYAETYLKAGTPLPAKFDEFLNPAELKQLTVSKLAEDQSKPSYELLKPAPKYQNVVNPARTPLMISTFHTKEGKRLVAFADGHIELVSNTDLDTLRGTQEKALR